MPQRCLPTAAGAVMPLSRLLKCWGSKLMSWISAPWQESLPADWEDSQVDLPRLTRAAASVCEETWTAHPAHMEMIDDGRIQKNYRALSVLNCRTMMGAMLSSSCLTKPQKLIWCLPLKIAASLMNRKDDCRSTAPLISFSAYTSSYITGPMYFFWRGASF